MNKSIRRIFITVTLVVTVFGFSFSLNSQHWSPTVITKLNIPVAEAEILKFLAKDELIIAIDLRGAWISTDGGKNFISRELPFYNVRNWAKSVIHITNNNHILIAVRLQLFVSDDHGDTFTESNFDHRDGDISSIQSHGNTIFVTFGPFHHICE